MTAGTDDPLTWKCDWGVAKYDEDAVAWVTQKLGRTPQGSDFEDFHIRPFADTVIENNLLTTAGVTRIANLITAGGGVAFTNTTARIGVGNGAGTAAVGDTALSASAGSTNQWWQVMDATFPTTAAGVITAKATFASGDGNFAWNEFAIDINTATVTSTAATVGIMLNHKTSIAQGTKASGQSWTASATITLS